MQAGDNWERNTGGVAMKYLFAIGSLILLGCSPTPQEFDTLKCELEYLQRDLKPLLHGTNTPTITLSPTISRTPTATGTVTNTPTVNPTVLRRISAIETRLEAMR